jgi:hypothetical protein
MQYKKTFSIYFLIFIIALQSLSGLLGGVSLIIDPSGTMIDLPVSWLAGSMFQNYLIPGIILLVVLGVFPMITLIGLINGTKRSLIYARLVGYALVIWIAVEIFIIGYKPEPPLQMIYGIVGIIILLLAYSSRVTNFYT